MFGVLILSFTSIQNSSPSAHWNNGDRRGLLGSGRIGIVCRHRAHEGALDRLCIFVFPYLERTLYKCSARLCLLPPFPPYFYFSIFVGTNVFLHVLQTYTPGRSSMPSATASNSSHSSNQSMSQGSEQLSKTNLYIRGLTPNTTDKDLVNLCHQ